MYSRPRRGVGWWETPSVEASREKVMAAYREAINDLDKLGEMDHPMESVTIFGELVDALMRASSAGEPTREAEGLPLARVIGPPDQEFGDPGRGVLARNVTVWICPDCAFAFDAQHTDNDGGYSCPACFEVQHRAASPTPEPSEPPTLGALMRTISGCLPSSNPNDRADLAEHVARVVLREYGPAIAARPQEPSEAELDKAYLSEKYHADGLRKVFELGAALPAEHGRESAETVWVLSKGAQHEGGTPKAVYATEQDALVALSQEADVLRRNWTEVWEQCQPRRTVVESLAEYLGEQRPDAHTYYCGCDYIHLKPFELRRTALPSAEVPQ